MEELEAKIVRSPLPEIRMNERGERCFIFRSRAHMNEYNEYLESMPLEARLALITRLSFGAVDGLPKIHLRFTEATS